MLPTILRRVGVFDHWRLSPPTGDVYISRKLNLNERRSLMDSWITPRPGNEHRDKQAILRLDTGSFNKKVSLFIPSFPEFIFNESHLEILQSSRETNFVIRSHSGLLNQLCYLRRQENHQWGQTCPSEPKRN
mmetsp:Transcript_47086/g.64118  ORF Transcript_47086/g.64118 Transcript_47086/m.64118 type:complete len:132 (+) Transcript_47086:1844-2239(+)